MQNKPEISVLLSVHNGQSYIQESIDSIQSQTYTNWELIIIDDGSTDKTSEILAQIKDPRIKVVFQKNMGLTKSLNKAAQIAKGDLLARQDADDISHKDRFRFQKKLFTNNPNLILVSSYTSWINSYGETLDIREAPKSRLEAINKITNLTSPYIHGSLMFKKSSFEAVNGYNEKLTTSQDFDLLIRLSVLGKEFSVFPDVLYNFRIHNDTITSKKWIKQIKNTMKCANLINYYYPNSVQFKTRLVFILKKMIIAYLSMINPEIIYK